MSDKYWVGFDLGGTKMLATVFDSEFKPCGRERKKTKGHAGSETGVVRISKTIRDALADAEIDVGQVAGIGVGFAGPLDLEKGVLFEAPNLGWTDVPLKDLLENDFACPVVVANDVDAGVFGEYKFGAAKGARCAIGVFPGTGIGGGCVFNGTILSGKNRSCMEIGHIEVNPAGPLCGCGQYGCLEAVASRLAVAAAAAQAVYRGQAPALMKIAGSDLSNIRSGALAQAVDEGDSVIEAILRTAARHVGVAIANVVHLLAPDIVVLGGGLVEALPALYVETATAAANERVLSSFVDTFQVKAAELGDDATVMGAAAWANAVVGTA
jgi:glucokinase